MFFRIFRFLGVGLLFLTAGYLILPSPDFPSPPPGSLQSQEPADTETIYRRSYFTNLSRGEVIAYYIDKFRISPGVSFPLLQIRLNRPPEEAATLVRDQTRSSWLEELVHPGREYLYINGFYPTKPTEQININNVHYENKITLRMVPSHPITRLAVLGLSAVCVVYLFKEYAKI
jgi:hypothetical protein